MPYDLYPAVDENYNFPPEVRLALSKSTELRNTLVPMTTVNRNNLLGAELWDGRLIFNTDTEEIEQYDSDIPGWRPSGISDHGGLSGLGDDDHPQYLLRVGDTATARMERVFQRTDTRSTTLGYTSGTLTTVTEKSGATTIKTTTLGYTADKLTTVTEVVDGITVTTTLTYDGSGTLTGTTRAVA